MGTQVRSKKVEQGDATRLALIEAARALFGARGYSETSLDDIAQAAGVTKGALYHHFENKEQLFRSVFELVKKELSGKVLVSSHVPTEALWDDLVARCRAFVDAHNDPHVQRIVLVDARAVLSWEQWNEVENKYGVVMLRALLRRAMHRGVIASQPLRSLSMILSGALGMCCTLVANSTDPDAARDEVMGIIERLLSGLHQPSKA